MYDATMHLRGNQYVELDGDRAFVETWVVATTWKRPAARSII